MSRHAKYRGAFVGDIFGRLSMLGLICLSVAAVSAQERIAASLHRAQNSGGVTEFALIGQASDLEAIRRDDGVSAVSAWLDNRAPIGRPRLQIASEFDFSVGSVQANSIRSLRFFAKVYFTGKEGSLLTELQSVDDSSEEDALYDATIQLYDFALGTWTEVGSPLIDTGLYKIPDQWRDHPYANRWSRPQASAGPYPGIDRTRGTGFVAGHISGGSIMRLRLVKDLEIGGAGWDISHAVDLCYVDIDAGLGSQRYYPIAHRATGDAKAQLVFSSIGEHGRVAALQIDDLSCDVSYWEDSQELSGPPTPPVHYEVWSEFDFSLVGMRYSLADLGSFRLQAEVYSTGWHEVNPLRIPSGPPVGFDDSSEEAKIHDAKIQIWNWSAQVWEDVWPWLDSSVYRLGDPWRDTEYARSWSRPDPLGPTLLYPGPWKIDRGITFKQAYVGPQSSVKIRFWKDIKMDTYGNWDIVHVFDYCWLEVAPRGVVALGLGCSDVPSKHPHMIAGGVPDASNGTPNFTLEIEDGTPDFVARIAASVAPVTPPIQIPWFSSCRMLVDPSLVLFLNLTPVIDQQGKASLALPIPQNASLVGGQLALQYFFYKFEANSARLGTSDALDIRFQ